MERIGQDWGLKIPVDRTCWLVTWGCERKREIERNKKISPAEAETGGGAGGWRRELRVRVSPSVSPNYTSHPPRKTRFRLCFYSFFHSFDHVYVTLNNMMINLQCLNILYKLNYTINGLVIGYFICSTFFQLCKFQCTAFIIWRAYTPQSGHHHESTYHAPPYSWPSSPTLQLPSPLVNTRLFSICFCLIFLFSLFFFFF